MLRFSRLIGLFCVAGFFEQAEHFVLVSHDAGLVEGIDALEFGGDGAGQFKEVNQFAKLTLGDIRRCNFYNGKTGAVGGDGGAKGVLVNISKGFALKIFQAV